MPRASQLYPLKAAMAANRQRTSGSSVACDINDVAISEAVAMAPQYSASNSGGTRRTALPLRAGLGTWRPHRGNRRSAAARLARPGARPPPGTGQRQRPEPRLSLPSKGSSSLPRTGRNHRGGRVVAPAIGAASWHYRCCWHTTPSTEDRQTAACCPVFARPNDMSMDRMHAIAWVLRR